MRYPSEGLCRTKQFLTIPQYKSLLQHYIATLSLVKTKQLHAHTITSGILPFDLRSKFAASYALCGHIPYARKLFDELPDRSVILYNVMIRMYLKASLPCGSLRVFSEMVALGKCWPDKFTYSLVVKACCELSRLDAGVVVHGRIVVAGFDLAGFVQNSLLSMYMNCGKKEAAQRVFDAMQDRSVVSWNTMINGCFRNGFAEDALMMFSRMVDERVEPDCATVVSVLPACAYMENFMLGREIHAMVKEKGLGKLITVNNALVDMYAKCSKMDEARLLFDKMSERDVVSWTTMINGYVLNGDARSGLALCCLMQHYGLRPNVITIASLLSACGSLFLSTHGRSLHSWALRQKLDSEAIVETALIDMYAKCKCMDQSFRVFASASKKRAVPWNAIISGCSRNGLEREAIKLFKQMLMGEVHPQDATLSALLPAYSILADFHQATNIHCYVLRSGFVSGMEVATGLIDIYAKCGSLESAHKIFTKIPDKGKDVITWSAIIAGYGKHGQGERAVSLFNEMVQSGVRPNEVTFTSILHACSHAGLVDEGLHLFRSMLETKLVSPQTDHYTCIVDLLGRAGRLKEAYDLIKGMTFKPNHAIWGALLGACVIHENVELGEIAAGRLFELEPENTGNYVLMAKIYAAVGRWKDAENVRLMMGKMGARKSPAHSLIEVRNM
ncbi:hypothetical protein UlMin_014646 [Ulmus minor]